jgi:plasmid stability protein
MATLTIRKFDDEAYQRLRERARANNRSLEAEARQLLEERTRDRATVSESLEEFQARLKAKYGVLPDSTDLIRRERDEG